VAAALSAYRWPGNLRQLHNALRTACALLDPTRIEIGWTHLPDDVADDLAQAAAAAAVLDDEATDLRTQSERTIRQIVLACEGNLSDAARRLGISRNTLYRKLREKSKVTRVPRAAQAACGTRDGVYTATPLAVCAYSSI
jgi:transcriptional regulator of acetoin/glycerol metabolism